MQGGGGPTGRMQASGRDRHPMGELHSGEVLGGRFVLQQRLGCGGSGVVWSALDTMVGERVAVKILNASVHNPANRERLRREVRSSRSGHPNLVSLHELHESEGRLFITMELINGPSLRDALRDRPSLIVDDAVHIGRQIATALDHLHGQGLVHRDVKPGNVMLSADGTAKLCDMGLARPLEGGVTVTETEMVVGTPTYMAPEMARGELIAASDVYALGLMLYQCLTGEVPLAGTTAVDTFMARQQGRPERIRKHHPLCPRWLDRLIGRMLEPDPGLRPTANRVVEVLERARFAWRPHRRDLRRAALAVIVAVVVGTAGAAAWRFVGAPPDPAEDATANELQVSVEAYDSGTVYSITDGRGRHVLALVSSQPWISDKTRVFRRRQISIADLDGDGRSDIVYANPDPVAAEQIVIHRRLADGSTELAAAWNLHRQHEYEGQIFEGFVPVDVECADLDGDGTPEIVIACHSTPYYLGEVAVLRRDGVAIMRVRHPGHIVNVRTGDRDDDGRLEIYAGATNNFHEQNVGNASSPVFFAVEADWSVDGQIVDLLGPGRTMTGAVPKGVEVHYLSFVNQTLLPPLTPWRHAVVARVSAGNADQFLSVQSDRMTLPASDKRMMLRSFLLDRDLRVTDEMWVVRLLEEHGIDPMTVPSGQFDVTYWNGSAWQPEVCKIPQAE